MKTSQLVLVGVMFFGLLTASPGADDPLRAEIRQLQSKPNAYGDDAVAGFSTEFVLNLTNRSAMAVDLPWPDRDSLATRYSIVGVEGQLPDGRWKYLIQGSVYTFGQTTYAACKGLAPNEAITAGETADLLLPVNELASMGAKPLLRLTLMAFCRQPDNQIQTVTFTTEPFTWAASAQR